MEINDSPEWKGYQELLEFGILYVCMYSVEYPYTTAARTVEILEQELSTRPLNPRPPGLPAVKTEQTVRVR